MIRFCLLCTLLVAIGCTSAQTGSHGKSGEAEASATSVPARPKLIVGITVDQMRYDYIDKYWNDFSNGGFKRLVNEGFFARNVQFPYYPTYTGPGHAAIFTGTTPGYNGILANDWFERTSGKLVYCSSDSTVSGVGTALAGGKMSPHYLLSTTIGDELKLFSNSRSKVIGIALKDRGSILPAGRTADAAYWFIGAGEGVWASSTWYMNELPAWVRDFNASGKADDYMKQDWSLLLDESKYDESHDDNNQYEMPFKGTIRPVFPYHIPELKAQNGNYDLLKSVPFGNSLTTDFARAAIVGEGMGKDEHTDMLCLSYSATDYIGHQFGIHSRESQDVYLRLDKEIEAFLNYLDETIGSGDYLLFLTADHGGSPTPGYMKSQGASAGYWKSDVLASEVQDFLSSRHGQGKWLLNEINQNIYLNRDLIQTKGMNLKAVQDEVASFIMKYDEVFRAFTSSDLATVSYTDNLGSRIQLGFSQKDSGDIIYVLKPGYLEYGLQGTHHGSPYRYDSHVPALFFGFGVMPGESFSPQTICDVAPTVSAICKIPFTSAAIGSPVLEAIK